MRFSSFMTFLLISFTALGLVGCGSSDSDKYVANNPAPQGNTGSLVFLFQPEVANQSPFVVESGVAKLVFRFYSNLTASGDPIDTRNHDFATRIAIENLSTDVRSVRITGFDSQGLPLISIIQQVTVVAGEETVVNATAQVVPVVLQSLSFSPADSTASDSLDGLNLVIGETAQVFLRAIYDDGTVVVVNNAGAEFLNDPADENSANVFEVSSTGSVRALAPGSSAVIARFAGQTLALPVEVSDSQNTTFTEIIIWTSSNPLEIAPGESAPVPVAGLTASGAVVLASPSQITYDLQGSPVFTVANGVVTVSSAAVGGEMASLAATYQNANGSTTTSQVLQLVVTAAE